MVQWLTHVNSRTFSFVIIIGFLISSGTTPVFADTISPIYPWSILGHDGQRTSFSEGPAPDNTELLWKTGNIYAGPITSADGRIFFCSFNYTEMWLFKINCASESNGTIIWSKTMRYRGDWPPYQLPSLTIYADKIYFTQGTLLYCLDEFSGQVIWEATSTPVDLRTPAFSVSPIVEGTSIIVTTGGGKYGSDEYLFSFNSSNGKTLWGRKLKGMASVASVSANAVLVNSYNMTSKNAYTEYFDKEKGTPLWNHVYEKLAPPGDPTYWDREVFLYDLPPPSIFNGRVFLGIGSSAYSLNLGSGDLIWNFTTQGPIYAAPAVAYGKIFVASSDGYLYALNQTTGDLLWKYPIVNCLAIPLGFISVAGGMVFVSTGVPATLYCINEADGKLIWSNNMGYAISGLCISNGNLVVSADEFIYVFGSNIVSTQSSISLDTVQVSPTVPPIMISGYIDPPRNGTVEIQWSIDNEVWYNQQVTALNGRYSYPWTPPCNGTFYFKAVWGGDGVFSGATSDVKSVVFSGYDYPKLKSDFDRLNSSYVELEIVNHSLQSQVSSLQSDKTNLESQVSSLQSDKTALQSQVSYLQVDKNNLESQVKSLESDKNILIFGLGTVTIIFLIVTLYLYAKRTRVRNQLP